MSSHGFGGHHGLAPGNELAVAVLADDVGVDVAGVHGEVIPQQVAQPGGVQGGAGAEHPVGIEAGELVGDPGHNVHRVGGHQEDPREARVGDGPDDGLEHRRVPLEQRSRRDSPGFWLTPGADDHNVGVGAVAVIPGVNFHAGGGKSHAVVQVHGLALGAVPVDVHQHQLVAHSLVQGGVGKAHAHHAGAHQDDFPFIQNHVDALLFQGAEGPAPAAFAYIVPRFSKKGKRK